MNSPPDISIVREPDEWLLQRELFEAAKTHQLGAPAVEASARPEWPTATRKIKVEADGDHWAGDIKPKIRLKGKWLEAAGFKPGTHATVKCIAPGTIEVCSLASASVSNQS